MHGSYSFPSTKNLSIDEIYSIWFVRYPVFRHTVSRDALHPLFCQLVWGAELSKLLMALHSISKSDIAVSTLQSDVSGTDPRSTCTYAEDKNMNISETHLSA
jgi:hypothetical protein